MDLLRTQVVLPALLCILCGRSLAADGPSRKPNILLILADDQRVDTIGALGNPHIRTPNLDRLAQEGVAFSHAYCMGSTMPAVCLPSRTMLVTGRSLYRMPAGDLRAPRETAPHTAGRARGDNGTLLPEVLAAAGYETFHIGKSGNEYRPGIQAFEHNIVRNDPSVAERTVSSQRHADAVIDFLRGRNTDRPFFIYLAPPVPHDPRIAPKEFMDLYDPVKLPLPPAYKPVHPFDNGEMTVRDEKLAPWPRTEEVVRQHLADHYACVSALDHHIGRILDCLRELGQVDETVVIFSSDNGLSLGDHGLMGKQNLYEFGGMHVPLVIAGPSIPRGQKDALVFLFDLYPTICDLAGAQVPPGAEGKSLVPVIMGHVADTRKYLFTAYRDVQRAVRTDRWKLLRYPRVDRTQLFDLQSDPHELNDLAAKPEFAGRVKDMMALLEKAQKEYGDHAPLVVPEAKPQEQPPPQEAPVRSSVPAG